MSHDTDHNLLFGVLALQAGLLDNDQFAAACAAWATGKDTPLADLLAQRGWLTPEECGEVERMLARHLGRHGGDARASLATLTRGNVERALASIADPDVAGSLATLPPADGPALPPTVHYRPGSRERYTRTRLHARGGIGQVWLARDEDFGREVALKALLPERADSQATWLRFVEEARITGQLEHPGIVPVYELAARDTDRQPFYTMRFIRGRTLADAVQDYHRRRRAGQAAPLELRELLSAFVSVCNAVAYAHARGVLHRDLKPANVVLGDYGEAIVLDWGLAKLRGREEGAADLPPVALRPGEAREQTVQGQVLGTPSYMAPEQAEGRPDLVEERSDVYGLGAVLYEILTGRPPFAGSDTLEVLAQVVAAPPTPPRQAVGSTPPALEAVCLKSLAKKPADRYASARALADDVRCWLADEPVTAYPEPWTTKARRWLARHRAVVSGTAAAVAVALASLGLATVLLTAVNGQLRAANGRAAAANTQLREANARERRAGDLARRQKQEAEANFRLARRAVDRYITAVAEDEALKARDLSGLRRQLLRSAVGFYQQFTRQRGDDPAVRFEQGRAFMRLAYITQETGSLSQAIGYYRRARTVLAKLAAERPAGVNVQTDLATTYHCLGCLNRDTGRTGPAEEAFRQALKWRQRLAREHPGDAAHQVELGNSWNNLGGLYWKSDRPERAKAAFAQGRDLFARLHRDRPRDPYYLYCLASAYNNLGLLEDEAHRLGQAEANYARARDLFAQLVREHPSEAEYQANRAQNLSNLGLLYDQTDRPKQAQQALRQAHEVLKGLVRQYPSVTDFAVRLGGADCNLGQAVEDAGDLPAAERWYARAVATLGGVLRKEPRHTFAREYLRNAHWKRAKLLARRGRPAQAVAEWDRAITLDDGPLRSHFRLSRAHSLAAAGDHARAAAEADELARALSLTGDGLYHLACVYALAAAAVRRDRGLSAANQDKLARRYGDRAVALLHRAHKAGYFGKPGTIDHAGKDIDLDALRSRADFQKLLRDLRAKGQRKQ
jgi:serine/threonine-protein kinase